MSYNPSDHAIEPGRILSAWVLCAAILLMAFGAGLISDNEKLRNSLLAQQIDGGAVTALTKSIWLPSKADHIGTGCSEST